MRILHYNDEETELHRFLAERGHQNVIVAAAADPFDVVRRESFDAAFVGLHPHGLDLLQGLRKRNADCRTTIITSDRNTRRAVEAMKRGAFDYLLSPLDFAEVERTYIMLVREHELDQERRSLEDQLARAGGGDRFVGQSPAVRNLRRLVEKAAASSAPVLITGATGTGKELISRVLHDSGPRRERPFVGINCNAIPSSLLEGELFGYRRGAFTGADADRPGLLVEADGGTFFFDEISDLEPALQGKLLRAVQEREVMPLGARSPRTIDVRFVAATNRDLGELVRAGRFREDLYYRLNVVPIRMPRLRDRPEDIAPLALHFLARCAARDGRAPLKIAPDVWRWLSEYDWPGNVRELENLCQLATALAEGEWFDLAVLELSDSFRRPTEQRPLAAALPANLRDGRDDAERRLLDAALARSGGNVARTAAELRISRTTLYAKLKRLGLNLSAARKN